MAFTVEKISSLRIETFTVEEGNSCVLLKNREERSGSLARVNR